MKKSLSLLLAIAMVFSMFATVAAAATDTQSKYDELVAAGIFVGRNGGDAALGSELTRAEFAGIIARLTGVKSDTAANFSDVPATHWAAKDIAAVVAAGYMQGTGDNKFEPSRNVTLQEVIAVAVRILGLEVDENATVEGTAGAWAQPYIAAAIAAGLTSAQADYTVNATRGALVDVVYEVFQVIQSIPKVTGYEVVSATKVVVSFSDGGQVEAELDEPLQLGKNTITVTYNDREYQVEVQFEAAAASAKAVGAKKIEVTFNKAVDDSKAKFAVKNGIANRDVDKFTFSEDKKKAVLELTTKLQAGETTVTVSGIEADDVVAKFTAEDERVTQVKFKSDKLALSAQANNTPNYNEVKVGYQILNQYGEEATNVGVPTFQVGKPTTSVSATNGVLTIQTPATAPFYLGEKVVISGYLRLSTYGVSFSETLEVGQPAAVDSVEIKGLYHPENKELNTGSTFSDYVLLIEVKDQYGNKLNAGQFNNGAFVTVSNPGIFNVPSVNPATDNQGPNKDQVGIPLAAPGFTPGFDGTNTIRIMTLFGGKQYTYDVEVKKAATVQKITLNAPSQVVAANDGTVKIPFIAEDQFGNQVKKFSDLNGKLSLWPQYDGNSGLRLKQDYVTKEAYLELVLPAVDPNQQVATPYPIMASVVGTANSSQITISIEKPAYPDSIAGLKSDVAATLAKDATTTIKPDYIIVKDNYGRDKKLVDLLADPQANPAIQGTHKVVVSVADGTQDVVTLSQAELVNKTDSITVTAKQKGSERIKIQLVDLKDVSNANDDVVVYSYESYIFSVVDSSGIVEYAVEQLPKISNKPGHQVDLKVTGKRSNGTTVALPADAYSVTTTNNKLVFNNGKLDATLFLDGDNDFDDKGEVKVKVIVAIYATTDQFEQEVVVTNEALKPTTIELQNAGSLKAENGVIKGPKDQITIENLFKTLKIKDQFGFEMDKDVDANALRGSFDVTISNVDDVTVTAGDEANTKIVPISGNAGTVTLNPNAVGTGDSFTVLFTSKVTGVRITARVVAE